MSLRRALALLPMVIVPGLLQQACDDSSTSGPGVTLPEAGFDTGPAPTTTTTTTTPPPPPPPPPPTCGDAIKNGTEACDKTDFGAATCATRVAPGWIGQLTCTAACAVESAACTTPATTFNALNTGWSTFDASTVNAGSKGFNEVGFDGRYVYFSPFNNGAYSGLVTRYDTQATFDAGASWSTFDVTSIDANAKGFHGVAFDGRYAYLTPYYDSDSTVHGIVLRHDTTASFTAAASWSKFDVSTLTGGQKGYGGSVFDGRYLYFAPYPSGTVTRLDTQGVFTSAAAWTVFDTTTVNAGSKGFFGATFDGRYIYLAPYDDGAGVRQGLVTRYDTQAAFGAAASWKTYDVTAVDAGLKGFSGATFDGRYVYLVPNDDGVPSSKVGRYDTQAAFDVAASWKMFDIATVNASAKGFDGATFDGRFIYFVPYNNGTWSPFITRYDTQAAFDVTGSWSTFDLSSLDTDARGFSGGAFDGRYVYLAPYKNGTGQVHGNVARFDAKSVSWLPKRWNASFY